MLRLRMLAIVGSCLALSMVGFACGSDREDEAAAPATTATTATEKPTNIVSNDDVRATKPGTPERTIVTWAQAVQYGDLGSVRSAYTQRVRDEISLGRMQAAARTIGPVLGRPEIVTPIVEGERARVRVNLVSYDADGKASRQLTTFTLQREDGRWLLDDPTLLLQTAAAMRQASP